MLAHPSDLLGKLLNLLVLNLLALSLLILNLLVPSLLILNLLVLNLLVLNLSSLHGLSVGTFHPWLDRLAIAFWILSFPIAYIQSKFDA